ncbi:MAG: DUF3828 domain-containing protein [Pyrinomonadaceae bacterium]
MRSKTQFLRVLLATAAFAATACNFSFSTSGNNTNVNSGAEFNAATASGTPTAASGESQSATAEALVADLYKAHDGKKSPFFQTKDRALVDKYFAKPLADLIWKDANNSSGEVGAIDGDPLYNAQDTEIKNFVIGRAEVKNDTADIPVTFTNFGQKVTITYALKQVDGSWKIENIAYGSGDSLMKWLRETYTDKPQTVASSGEFEGRYIVGDTSCTVKPVKMAFEVRWAKGSGVEMFAFTEGNTFESAPDQPDSNSFVFDDENYNKGTFYRADGRSFAVKRAK